MKLVYIDITGEERITHTRTITAQVPDDFDDEDVSALAQTLDDAVPLDAGEWQCEDSEGIEPSEAFVSRQPVPASEEPDVVINAAGTVISMWEEA